MRSSNKESSISTVEANARAWVVHRRLVRTGQALMAVGLGIALVHWLTHLEAFGPSQPPLWLDLAAGYPAGGFVFILGAMLAGRRKPSWKKQP
jgi:hypothetical protein